MAANATFADLPTKRWIIGIYGTDRCPIGSTYGVSVCTSLSEDAIVPMPDRVGITGNVDNRAIQDGLADEA